MAMVIEGLEVASTQWGVSLTSTNPEPEDYFPCIDSKQAVRLKGFIDLLPVLQDIRKFVASSLASHRFPYDSPPEASLAQSLCDRAIAVEGLASEGGGRGE